MSVRHMVHQSALDPTVWHALRRHARLWRRFAVQSFVRETQYRAQFVATIFVGLLRLLLALIPIWLLFGYTDEIAGWTQSETIALVGFYRIVEGMLATLVAPNLTRLGGYIERGDLDPILLRPVSSLFLTLLRYLQPAELANVLIGLLLVAFSLAQAGITASPADIALATLLMGCGVILLACAWAMIVFIVFWVISVEGVALLFHDFLQSGQYPVSFFPGAIRTVLTFVVPVAFATTFPVEALSGERSWWLAAGGVALCGIALVLLRAYWRYALRFYTSASS